MIVTIDIESTSFLVEHHAAINWSSFTSDNPLTLEIVRSCGQFLDWNSASWKIELENTELVQASQLRLNWSTVTLRAVNTKLLQTTNVFLKTFAEFLDWQYISNYQKLTMAFLKKYARYILWDTVSYSSFTVKMFKYFRTFIDWDRLVRRYDLSLDELLEMHDYIPWNLVARYQDLSEADILALSTMINWVDVAECQDISLPFIDKYRDALPLASLRRNPYLLDRMRDVFALFAIPEIGLTAVESSDPCPICRDADGPQHKIKCGHVFHKDCILGWTERCRTCPMCRTDL